MFSQECQKGSIALPNASKPKENDLNNKSVAQHKVPSDDDGWLNLMFRVLFCSWNCSLNFPQDIFLFVIITITYNRWHWIRQTWSNTGEVRNDFTRHHGVLFKETWLTSYQIGTTPGKRFDNKCYIMIFRYHHLRCTHCLYYYYLNYFTVYQGKPLSSGTCSHPSGGIRREC